MASARSGTACSAGRRGRCWAIAGRRGCGCGGRISCGARCCRHCGRATALEVGGIPACALELKTWGRQLLVEFWSAANRAVGQRVVTHFLQNILGMAAGVAFVGVNGHVKSLRRCCKKTFNYRLGKASQDLEASRRPCPKGRQLERISGPKGLCRRVPRRWRWIAHG